MSVLLRVFIKSTYRQPWCLSCLSPEYFSSDLRVRAVRHRLEREERHQQASPTSSLKLTEHDLIVGIGESFGNHFRSCRSSFSALKALSNGFQPSLVAYRQSPHATSAATTHWIRHLSCEPTSEYFHRTVLVDESIPEP